MESLSTFEKGRVMSALRAQPLLALLLLSACAGSQAPSDEPDIISREILKYQTWVTESEACPSELMPNLEIPLKENTCESSHLDACLSRCTSGDGSSCYWLAYALQQSKAPAPASDVLYQRACNLGIISGCTNRAADLVNQGIDGSRVQTCAAQTFSKGCSLNDPWACTMYALHLGRGMGVPKDKAAALKALEKSCRYGEKDPACVRGMQLKEQLLGAN